MEAGDITDILGALEGVSAKLRALSLTDIKPSDRDLFAHLVAHPELHVPLLRQLLGSPDGNHEKIVATVHEYCDHLGAQRGDCVDEDDGYPVVGSNADAMPLGEDGAWSFQDVSQSSEEMSSSDTDGEDLLDEELEDALRNLTSGHADRKATRERVRNGEEPQDLWAARQEAQVKWANEQREVPEDVVELEDEAAEVELAVRHQLDEVQDALEDVWGVPAVAAPEQTSSSVDPAHLGSASDDSLDELLGFSVEAPPQAAPSRAVPSLSLPPSGTPATKRRRIDAHEAPFEQVAEELTALSGRLDELEALAEREKAVAITLMSEIHLLCELCAQKGHDAHSGVHGKDDGEDDRDGREGDATHTWPSSGLLGEDEVAFEAVGRVVFPEYEQVLRDLHAEALKALHERSGDPGEIARATGAMNSALQDVRLRIASIAGSRPQLKRAREEEAIIEIRAEQASAELIIPERAFQRLCSEILWYEADDLHFGADAFQALQEATETYLTELFDDANVTAIHAERTYIRPADIQLVRRLRGERS